MLAIFAALVVASTPAAPCALNHVQSCRDTNDIMWDRAFVREVRKFVGKGRANYLYRGALADQQLDVFNLPDGAPARIGVLYRLTGCRLHSCTEKGAAVVTPSGNIVATAILHSDCLRLPEGSEDCPYDNTLSVFVRDPSGAKPVVDDLSEWAAEKVRGAYNATGFPSRRLRAIEVFSVASGVPRRVSVRRLDAADPLDASSPK